MTHEVSTPPDAAPTTTSGADFPRAADASRALSAGAKRLAHSGRSYLGRLRKRAFFWTVGLLAAGMATAAIIGGGWIPAVGTALAAAAVAVNRVASRMDRERCLQCGTDLTNRPVSPYGTACPQCGALHMPLRRG